MDRDSSKLTNRGIFTLRNWCEANGHKGVTKECLLSAKKSDNKKVREMAKEARIKNIIKGK